MNEEVKPLFPVATAIMSASYHPPVVSAQAYGMAISLLFDDFSIELNGGNKLRSAYKATTYSFTMDNPSQEAIVVIKYALNKTSDTAKAFLTFLSNIECFTREMVVSIEESEVGRNLMSTQGEINILIPKSSQKVYSFALSIFATREKDDELAIFIDSIDIARSPEPVE